jgi:hypothetical protein
MALNTNKNYRHLQSQERDKRENYCIKFPESENCLTSTAEIKVQTPQEKQAKEQEAIFVISFVLIATIVCFCFYIATGNGPKENK